MTAPLIVAVDPGPPCTGIVGRSRDTLRAWSVVCAPHLSRSRNYAARALTHVQTGCTAAALFAAAVWMVDPRRQQNADEHEHAETARGDQTRGDRKGDTS